MVTNKKDQIRALLKSIETGDPDAVAVVNESKYVQHNPHTLEGSEGLAELFKRISETSPSVRVVRAFEDGDFVFAHTEYDFADRNIGFEVFRFEEGQAVEHWDNIQPRLGPNPSGHTMTDGPTEATHVDRTETNRSLVRSFVNEVLIGARVDEIETYVDRCGYTEHNPDMADGFESLLSALGGAATKTPASRYQTLHRVLADGDFVLSMCEGVMGDSSWAFYDLFRVDDGKVVEHWDTSGAIPPRSEWNNNNGKF